MNIDDVVPNPPPNAPAPMAPGSPDEKFLRKKGWVQSVDRKGFSNPKFPNARMNVTDSGWVFLRNKRDNSMIFRTTSLDKMHEYIDQNAKALTQESSLLTSPTDLLSTHLNVGAHG